jgi:flagellar protein FliO/FliZ
VTPRSAAAWRVGLSVGLAALGAALALHPGEAGALAWRAGLVVLAGLAVAAVARRRPASATRPPLRVAARASLGGAAAVAVVEVDGRRFLVGAGGRTASLLAELGPAAGERP